MSLHQVRSLRKRQVVGSYVAGERLGTYWGIRSHVADYGLPDALPCPPDQTLALANVPTRLKGLDTATQKRLINWGYAICDTAMRRWVDTAIPKPGGFPYPGGVG
jgi:NTE family protein